MFSARLRHTRETDQDIIYAFVQEVRPMFCRPNACLTSIYLHEEQPFSVTTQRPRCTHWLSAQPTSGLSPSVEHHAQLVFACPPHGFRCCIDNKYAAA